MADSPLADISDEGSFFLLGLPTGEAEAEAAEAGAAYPMDFEAAGVLVGRSGGSHHIICMRMI